MYVSNGGSRFIYIKNDAKHFVSVADHECATIVTCNKRLCNTLDAHYPEILYKNFAGGCQLVEKIFPK